ncbi:putative inactive purple acid phosphatase 28 [Dichanthelium oligosanthes]|uniref:Putative inactive purple acid phosphatase 28 n=1 Tax=Dichanthelium oligosanthes TaxID=888268 RepID=A0A1E5WJ93_9POAL|nr:putative inactive purple acid phosphatase 28 [Dichanthelium oligosanthes]
MAASHLTALVALLAPCLLALLLLRLAAVLDSDPDAAAPRVKAAAPLPLRFRHDGAFKILQVADMHFGNGAATRCRDVAPDGGGARCSDLNTTRFLRRVIEAERPDLIAFTGDNIFGGSATDAAESLLRAISPAIEYKVPWAAILGNHDQESTMTREELMTFMSLMDYSVSQVNPPGFLVHGFGNYHIGIHGPFGSELVNTSLLNLYFLDSGDREVVNGVKTYGWIKESQLSWLRATSLELQKTLLAPALVFFHIPIPEVRGLWYSGFKGQYQEGVACSSVNSGVLDTLVSMGDVKSVFLGHDHLNDFCGNLNGIWFCYGGGFGYHAYGRPHWPRRARVIYSELKKGQRSWMEVESIQTWKLLDDEKLSKIDEQVLWRHSTGDSHQNIYLSGPGA